ncbi:MAG: hypothetical protein KF866_09225 [Phycisphaeraceae bacterium]|nr:hypothetical protein [Phycisphaeraceae bacterium]
MILPPSSRIRLRAAADPARGKALAAALTARNWREAAVIKQTDTSSVLGALITVGDQALPVIAKSRLVASFPDAVKAFVRSSSLDRQRSAATWLLANDFPAPRWYVHLSGIADGLHVQTLFVQAIRGNTLLTALQADIPAAQAIREPLGVCIGRLLLANRLHADLKPSNMVLAGSRPMLVDAPLRTIRPFGRGRALVRMLRDLSLEPSGLGITHPDHWLDDVAAYALRTLWDRPPAAAAVAAVIRRVTTLVAARGNTSPIHPPRQIDHYPCI